MKIILQNQTRQTVINNVQPEDLAFWKAQLHDAFLRNEVQLVETDLVGHQAA